MFKYILLLSFLTGCTAVGEHYKLIPTENPKKHERQYGIAVDVPTEDHAVGLNNEFNNIYRILNNLEQSIGGKMTLTERITLKGMGSSTYDINKGISRKEPFKVPDTIGLPKK